MSNTNERCKARDDFGHHTILRVRGGKKSFTLRKSNPDASGPLHDFISVGAYCQGDAPMAKAWASEGAGVMAVSYLHSLSESCFPSGWARLGEPRAGVSGSGRKRRPAIGNPMAAMVACEGGTHRALSRREASKTRRLNSSLRSRRTAEAQCSAVCPGLDKTLFASVGPNSHGRGHRISKAGAPVVSPPHACAPGRIKPCRGLRADEASFRRVPELVDVGIVPPYVTQVIDLNWDQSCCWNLLSSLSDAGFVGLPLVAGGLLPLVNGSVADHGEKDAQQSAGHGYVGLGLSDPLDSRWLSGLADDLLAGIGTAQGQSSLAQGPVPMAIGIAGFGDVAGLPASGGFLIVGCQSGPELQGIGIGKTGEVADLRGNDAAPYFVNAWNTFEQLDQGHESGLAIGGDDASPQRFALAFQQGDDIQKVAEGLPLNILEQMAAGQDPLLSRRGIEPGAGQIGGQQDRSHAVLDAGKRTRKAVPVPAELAQLRYVFIGNPAQRTVSPSQAGGDIGGVVAVILAAFAAEAGQFGGVGDVHTCYAGSEAIDEPFSKAHSLNGQMTGLGPGTYPLLDTCDAFGMTG